MMDTMALRFSNGGPCLLAELAWYGVDFGAVLVPALIVTAAFILLSGLFVFSTRAQRGPVRRSWPSMVVYGGFVLSIVVLALSGLGSIIFSGHMSGYGLLGHVTAAGAFTFLLIGIAAAFLPWSVPNARNIVRSKFDRWWLTRWSAWGLVVSSLAAAGTMLVSMLPILDTNGLLQVAELHRYAGLLVVLTACVHVYAISCQSLGWR